MRTRNRSGQRELGRDRQGQGSERSPAARRAVTMAAAVGLALFTSSCSFIVETKTSQCQTNTDCEGIGDSFICVKETQLCVNLLSEECKFLYGNSGGPIEDNAIIIGSALPTSGSVASSGLPLRDAIDIAIDDIKSKANGIPVPNENPRPLLVIHCDDGGDETKAPIVAKHLAEDLKVPAIIGSAFSGPTIAMANTVTIDSGALLFSPAATSAEITNLSKDQNKGLVWRTAPSDNFQTQALAQYVPQVVTEPTTDRIVVITEQDDPYGTGLAKSLETLLMINGGLIAQKQAQYSRIAYNPENTSDSPGFSETVDLVTAGGVPQIVIILTSNPVGVDYMGAIDKKLEGNPTRPRYIFADGGRIPELWDYKDMNDDLRKRISGSSPGQADSDSVYSAFTLEFKADVVASKGDPTTFGAAGAYDITFLLAYTSAAVLAQKKPLTGQNFANQLKTVSDKNGPLVKAGDSINDGFNFVVSGNIDFVGASGPLDFDPTTGEAASNIQIWCLPSDGNGKAKSAINSTLYYDVSAGALVGKIDPACN